MGWGKMVSHGKVADDRETHTDRDRDRDTARMMVASLHWVLGATSVVFHLEILLGAGGTAYDYPHEGRE